MFDKFGEIVFGIVIAFISYILIISANPSDISPTSIEEKILDSKIHSQLNPASHSRQKRYHVLGPRSYGYGGYAGGHSGNLGIDWRVRPKEIDTADDIEVEEAMLEDSEEAMLEEEENEDSNFNWPTYSEENL